MPHRSKFAWDTSHALNAICPYFTMFPLEFPIQVLDWHRNAQLILDPFCGRGTTLYAARSRGIRAIGIDCSPVAVAISRAKLAKVSVNESLSLAKRLIDDVADPDVPDGEFWSLAFHKETLQDLCRLRLGLLREPLSDAAILLTATVIGCLHGPLTKVGSYLSNQMQRTFSPKPDYAVRYWKKRGLNSPHVDVLQAIDRKLKRIELSTYPIETGRWSDVLFGDAANSDSYAGIPKGTDLVITSPPYYGMRSYLPDQWLRSWFLGNPPHVQYSDGRRLPSTCPSVFAEALGRVWSNVARTSNGNLDVCIRFGALASRQIDAQRLLLESFEHSGVKWQIISTRSAATADVGKRQAGQMRTHGAAIAEYDIHALIN